MRTVERAAYAAGGLLLLSGVIHVALLVIGGGTWEGPLSLRKAATFGLSFGLTLVNVTFIASFVPLKDRTRTLLLGIFAAACVLETSLVSLQVWRGVPSHFNVETPFDAAVAQLLAFGGFSIAKSFEHHVADLGPLRLAGGTFDVQSHDIFAGFCVLVNRVLIGGESAIAKVPTPGTNLAIGLVLKSDHAPV